MLSPLRQVVPLSAGNKGHVVRVSQQRFQTPLQSRCDVVVKRLHRITLLLHLNHATKPSLGSGSNF